MVTEYLIAGALAGILTVTHACAGEMYFFKGISRQSYPNTPFGDGEITRRLMKGAWHILTVTLLGVSVVLFAMAFTDLVESPKMVARMIAILFVGATLVVAAYAVKRPDILYRAPLWIATAGTAAFAYLGTL